MFIVSTFIDTETCSRVCQKIVTRLYPNRTYGFSSPTVLCEVVARVPVVVISPVGINKIIGFKAVPQVHCNWLQVNHIKIFFLIFVKCIFRSARVVDL